ncbi:MAG: hypothetical protein AB7P69_21280 [Candidatus Binatia bacterium]
MARHLPNHPKNHKSVTQREAKGLESRLLTDMRLRMTASIAMFALLLMAPALALAHGGMGPEEIGPPMMTSGLLGFVGYWVVMLWPSAKKKDDQDVGTSGQNPYTPRTDRFSHKRSVRVKRTPRLRKIEGRGQFGSDQNTRRKASDG